MSTPTDAPRLTTIAVRESEWRRLSDLKNLGESMADVIKRVLDEREGAGAK